MNGLSASALMEASRLANNSFEREHVTPYMHGKVTINIETGNENFESFLSSWEARKPVHSKERKTRKAIIPNKEVEYFAHVKRQTAQNSSPGSYVEFLDKLHPETSKSSHTIVSKSDKKTVDKFHHRLTKEKRSSVPTLTPPQPWANRTHTLQEHAVLRQAHRKM